MKANLALEVLVVVALAAGCGATKKQVIVGPQPAAGSAFACDPERDRAAILAMAGEYDVSYAFDETAALFSGYALRGPYRAAGAELVVVVDDEPRHIGLQHILMVEADGKIAIVKHWRQEWRFEDGDLLEYRGAKTWQKRHLPASELTCTWTQAVFEVTDGPRYESWGRWSHSEGSSSWTSHETWRPLPRREYTKRSDYDVLVGMNRQTITPTGWVHEQDNSKLVQRGGPHYLARERGVNTYTRAAGRDFGPARRYWEMTASFWRDVRAAWDAAISTHARLDLAEVGGARSFADELFALAHETPTPGSSERQREIAAVISRRIDDDAKAESRKEPR